MNRKYIASFGAVALLVVACGLRDNPSKQEITEYVSSAITSVSNAVDWASPAGFGLIGVAVAASDSRQIGDRDSIFRIGETSPGIANAGPAVRAPASAGLLGQAGKPT